MIAKSLLIGSSRLPAMLGALLLAAAPCMAGRLADFPGITNWDGMAIISGSTLRGIYSDRAGIGLGGLDPGDRDRADFHLNFAALLPNVIAPAGYFVVSIPNPLAAAPFSDEWTVRGGDTGARYAGIGRRDFEAHVSGGLQARDAPEPVSLVMTFAPLAAALLFRRVSRRKDAADPFRGSAQQGEKRVSEQEFAESSPMIGGTRR